MECPIKDDVKGNDQGTEIVETAKKYLYSYFGSNEKALVSSILTGDNDQIMKLVDKNVDLNIVDENGNGMLYVAVQGNQPQTIVFLVNLGLDINMLNQQGINPLMYAIKLRNDLVASEIIKIQSLRINELDRKGRTALHYAARYGAAKIANQLLEAGINVDVVDAKGNNALHVCAKTGNFNVAKVLLRWHVDTERKNKHEFIPLGVAVFHKRREMVGLILAAMRGTQHKDFEGIVKTMLDLPGDKIHYMKVLENTPVSFSGGVNDFETYRVE